MSAYKIMNPTVCKTDDDVRNKIYDITLDSDSKVIFPTGYPEAFIGLAWSDDHDSYSAVYNKDKIIEQLMIELKDPMSPDQDLYLEAREFFEFNIAGARFSDYAPVLYILTS